MALRSTCNRGFSRSYWFVLFSSGVPVSYTHLDVYKRQLFARACDPVLGFMKATGQYSTEAIVEQVLMTCFDGLHTRQPG